MNNCCFSGRLVADPELRELSKQNTFVVNFTIAINKPFKKSDNTWGNKVAFADCVAWAQGAENIARRFRKGDPIYIEASLETDQWETEEGKKRSRNRFRIDHFERPLGLPNNTEHQEEQEVKEQESTVF